MDYLLEAHYEIIPMMYLPFLFGCRSLAAKGKDCFLLLSISEVPCTEHFSVMLDIPAGSFKLILGRIPLMNEMVCKLVDY